MARINVLSVASEAVPLIKTGGLADVVGALPAALAPEGVDMRVMIPAYPGLPDRLVDAQEVWHSANLTGGPAQVLAGRVGGMQVMLLDAPHFFDRQGGIYSGPMGDWWDNAERFAALSWAAAQIVKDGVDGFKPDILHAHDWQGGFAPAYLRYAGAPEPSVMTIHNIAFQGHAPAERLAALRLPPEQFHPGGLEYYGNLSSLKAGLMTASAVTTVSPSYAEELLRPEFGMGLQGVIAARAAAGQMHGILNGVEAALWSPETDSAIQPYSAAQPAGKAENRARLIAEFGLGDVPGPLVVLVSRLTDQKGIDILPEVLPEFTAAGGGFIMIGTGYPHLEEAMTNLAARFPERIGVRIGYDEALSHRLFAGGDAVLVPSRFEPCGLTQMYGLRYGTIPVVAATGGLNDTVIGATPASLAARAATGIKFHPVEATTLAAALRRLHGLYADKRGWTAMMKRAMKAPVGWEAPAARYADLYRSLMP